MSHAASVAPRRGELMAETIDLKLRIWRQESADAPGAFMDFDAEGIPVDTPQVKIDAPKRVDATPLITFHIFIALLQSGYWQPGDLAVLRDVFHGFSEEARTRVFPSPSFGGFGISTFKVFIRRDDDGYQ